ncbi:DDB1- and CUL4-associated factor 5 [Bactrocera oleae]|uniref:DDB1- and CUL4-associated factor 5 n=1 Tax=Bactrocera oleae TaxID=104688 RepID=UPI00387EC5A8
MIQSTQSTRGVSSNLYHQLVQRELNLWPQRNPQTFTGHLYTERYRVANNLFKTDLRAHYGCVNAIEFSYGGRYLASGGDDKRVLIWDIEKAIAHHGRPRVLQTEHTSNIFCLGFDRCNRIVLSGGNDDLVIAHDFETGKLVNVFKHNNPVYGLSIDPKCDSIFATACEDGQILVFDQRVDTADPLVVAQQHTSFHAVEFHPAGGNFLVTANSKRGAAFWDIRKPHHPVIQYGGHVDDPPSCMSVRFNSNGSLILALRRRLPPILYNTQSPEPVCTFYHGNYYNSCTMKSCTFAGENDEFVLSGSDDFNLYVWRVSDVNLERTDQWVENTQMVLYGHRSIVNQVRYNPQKCLLASSGVEKIVKLWSPFSQKDWTGSLLEKATCPENPRELYLPYNISSMSTSPHSWSHMSHDYSSRNTNEDPRMMAFFDSLIQQEIESWDADSSTDSSHNSDATHSCSSSNDSSDSSPDDESDDDDDDDGGGDGGDVVTEVISIPVNVPNGNSVIRERPTRHVKRRFTKRKDLKRRKSIFRKKSKPQRHAFANRIAYLIATKRSRLRRLAIKGASLGNRRPYKILKVCDNSTRKSEASSSKSIRSRSQVKRHQASQRRSQNVSRRNNFTIDQDVLSGTIASTSSAVASGQTITNTTSEATTIAGGTSSHRYQRRKYKKRSVYDTSSDDGREMSASISTIPSNAPSTSTGITTTLKDDIIRLRQHQQNIIDSDEYEDDEEPSSSSSALQRRSHNIAEVEVDPTVQPTKKLNGVRRINDAAARERTNILNESNMNSERLISFSVERVINQQSPIHSNTRQVTENPQILSNDSSSTTPIINNTVSGAIETTQLPQTQNADSLFNISNISDGSVNINHHNINNSSGSSISHIVMPNRRRRAHMAFTDNYSSHSNSRLSNSSYADEAVESSASSTYIVSDVVPETNDNGLNSSNVGNSGNDDTRHSAHIYSTPLKRRRITIIPTGDDGEAGSDTEAATKWNHDNNNSNSNMLHNDHDYPISSSSIPNVNSHKSFLHNTMELNGICVGDDTSEAAATNLQKLHHRSTSNGSVNNNTTNNASHHNYELNREHSAHAHHQQNATLLLRTPDSGISIGATVTPGQTSSICPSSNESTTSRWHHSNGGGMLSSDGGTTPNNSGTVISHHMLPLCDDNSNATMGLFQQKVARVRRNYRKKFAEDSDESD